MNENAIENYLANIEANLDSELRNVKFKDIEEGFGLVIPTRYKPESLSVDKFSLSVTYSFSSGVRANSFRAGGKVVKYGADNMTYRRLYVILCTCFNGGDLFIDTYFHKLFQRRMGRQAKAITSKLKRSFKEYSDSFDEVIESAKWTKQGTLDRRTRGYRLFAALQEWKPVDVKGDLRVLSLAVKEDIKKCLATGLIDLNYHTQAASTVALRTRLGLTPVETFYASGDLIDHITLYFKVALDDGE